MTKAVINNRFTAVNVHKTPNGRVEDTLWRGYAVEVLDEIRRTATVTWVKIAYVFGGENKTGWMAVDAPLYKGGARYPTLDKVIEPEPMPSPASPPPLPPVDYEYRKPMPNPPIRIPPKKLLRREEWIGLIAAFVAIGLVLGWYFSS